MKKKLKPGDKITMYFKMAGVTSTEKRKILAIDKNTITTENEITPDGSDERENEIFSRTTGKCLNDNTTFGASRSIDPYPYENS